jgi:hypothetical protein
MILIPTTVVVGWLVGFSEFVVRLGWLCEVGCEVGWSTKMLVIEAWSGVKAHKPGHYVVVRSRLGGNKLGTITARPGLTLCQVVLDLQRHAAKLLKNARLSFS